MPRKCKAAGEMEKRGKNAYALVDILRISVASLVRASGQASVSGQNTQELVCSNFVAQFFQALKLVLKGP